MNTNLGSSSWEIRDCARQFIDLVLQNLASSKCFLTAELPKQKMVILSQVINKIRFLQAAFSQFAYT